MKKFLLLLLLVNAGKVLAQNPGGTPTTPSCANLLNYSSANEWCEVWPAPTDLSNTALNQPVMNGYYKLIYDPTDTAINSHGLFFFYSGGSHTIVTLSDVFYRYLPYVGTNTKFDLSGNLTCSSTTSRTCTSSNNYSPVWLVEAYAGDHSDANWALCTNHSSSAGCDTDSSGIFGTIASAINNSTTTIALTATIKANNSTGAGCGSGNQFNNPGNYYSTGYFGSPLVQEHYYLWIDTEEIDAIGATLGSPCTLTNVTRGVNGTSATGHAAGASIWASGVGPTARQVWPNTAWPSGLGTGSTLKDFPGGGHPYNQYAFDTKRHAIWLEANGNESGPVAQTWYYCVGQSSTSGQGALGANCDGATPSNANSPISWNNVPGANCWTATPASNTCTVTNNVKGGALAYDAADDILATFGRVAGANTGNLHILCPDANAHNTGTYNFGCAAPASGQGPFWQAPTTTGTTPPVTPNTLLLYMPYDGNTPLYSSLTTYTAGQYVNDGLNPPNTYQALQGSTGQSLSNGTYWQKTGFFILFQGTLATATSTNCNGSNILTTGGGTVPIAYIWTSACTAFDIDATRGQNVYVYAPLAKKWTKLQNITAPYNISGTNYYPAPAPIFGAKAAWDTKRNVVTFYEGPQQVGQTDLRWGQYRVGLYTGSINMSAATPTITWTMSAEGVATTNQNNQPAVVGTSDGTSTCANTTVSSSNNPPPTYSNLAVFNCDNQKTIFEYDSIDDIYVLGDKISSSTGINMWQLAGSALGVSAPVSTTQITKPYGAIQSEELYWTNGNKQSQNWTNAPVTFGMPIADSLGIPCTVGGATGSTLQLQNNSGAAQPSQFRCLGKWPSGNAKWMLVDGQIPSFTTGGVDKSLQLVSLSFGGGNSSGTMGTQCSGTSPTGCFNSNQYIVNTGAATFLINETGFNIFDDVLVGSTHIVAHATHGATDGFTLQGPLFSATQSYPTNYPLNCSTLTCATIYSSINDTVNTTLTVEDNGPLRTELKVSGDMDDSSGDIYEHYTCRMTFWANRVDAKVICMTRNADHDAVGNDFKAAFKPHNLLEIRDTVTLGASQNVALGNPCPTNASCASTTTTKTSAQDVYAYQGYSNRYPWSDFTSTACTSGWQDGCPSPPLARTTSNPGVGCLDGSLYYYQCGYEFIGTGGTPITASGTSVYDSKSTYLAGWADLDDGTNGVEVGIEQMSARWPKSIDLNANQIRIGIDPNQTLYTANTGNGQYYVTPYVAYHGYTPVLFDFHSGTQSDLQRSEEFLDFQHPLATKVSAGYYNSAVQNGSGTTMPPNYAIFYPLPDPVATDTYTTGTGVSGALSFPCDGTSDNGGAGGTVLGACMSDVLDATSPTSHPPQMSYFKYFFSAAAGAGNQASFGLAYLEDFLARDGVSGRPGTQPGRYKYALNWNEYMIEHAVARNDFSTGWRGDCSGTPNQVLGATPNLGSPTCPSYIDPLGRLRTSFGVNVPGGYGQRGWMDVVNSDDHYHIYSEYLNYWLTGDEWIHEVINQGMADTILNLEAVANNTLNPNNSFPHYSQAGVTRAVGHRCNATAWYTDFISSGATVPTDATAANALFGCSNAIGYGVAAPLIGSGYPVGLTDTVGCIATSSGTGDTKNPSCSGGISPVRGNIWPPVNGGGDSCLVPTWSSGNNYVLNSEVVESSVRYIGLLASGPSNGGAKDPASNPTYWATTPVVLPCENNGSTQFNHVTTKPFMEAVLMDGLQNFNVAYREAKGFNWGPITFTGVGDGTSTSTVTQMSDKLIQQYVFGAAGFVDQEAVVNTGVATTSGMIYDHFFHYFGGPPNIGGNVGGSPSRDCRPATQGGSPGCSNGTSYKIWDGFEDITNSTKRLDGTTNWQSNFELYISAVQYSAELYDYLMQTTFYNILNNQPNKVPSLYGLSFSITDGTHSGTCTFANGSQSCTANAYCAPSTTCTITWTPNPTGVNVNGDVYRVNYYPCSTALGDSCPKTIEPLLKFLPDATTTTSGVNGDGPCTGGLNATDPLTANGSGQTVGCWLTGYTPDTHANWFWTIPLVDSSFSSTATSSYSFTVPTTVNGASVANVTLSLYEYATSSSGLLPPGSLLAPNTKAAKGISFQ